MTSMPAECAACISEKYGYEFQVRSALYSPVEYIQRKRLFNAAKLLADTDKSVTDIALSCGFSNPSYFSKQLRELMDRTPSEYRTMVREQLDTFYFYPAIWYNKK